MDAGLVTGGAVSGARRPAWWTPSRREVWTRAASHGAFVAVPLLITAFMLAIAIGHHNFAVDFRSAFWPAGNQVLHGMSPYASASSFAASHGFAFVYPAPGALLFAGFAWIPSATAGIVFASICVASAFGILAIVGVRDWRLYGLTLMWPAVISGWQTANVSLPLAFGTAVAWRYRNRPFAAGLTVGLIVSIKLFLWPLGLWLLVTRRLRAFGWALATGVCVNAFAWAVLGFDRLGAYLRVVNTASGIEERAAYTPLALVLKLGASTGAADAITVVLGVLCIGLCIWLARKGRDSSALLLAIVLSLIATPVVWIHYFVLLLVPLAIMRPRLSPAWLLGLVLFACPVTTPALWQLVLALTAIGLLVLALLRRPALETARGRLSHTPGHAFATSAPQSAPAAGHGSNLVRL